jgi:hypothetical protein
MFEALAAFFGVLFAVAFAIIVVPPLLESGDIIGAFAAGFVNPYASGYSLDTIICGLILITWVLYERSVLGMRHGWIAIPLTFAPGVATAFGFYLVLRSRQLAARKVEA